MDINYNIPPFRHMFEPKHLAAPLSKKRVAGSARVVIEDVEKPKRNKSQPLARSHDSNADCGFKFLDFLKTKTKRQSQCQKQPGAAVRSQGLKRKISSNFVT